MKSLGIVVSSVLTVLIASRSAAHATEWRSTSAGKAAGSIGVAGEIDRVRIAAAAGMTLTVTITGANGFIPGVGLKNDIAPLDFAPFTKGVGTKKVTITKFPVTANMILALEISGPNDTIGSYTITTTRKFAKAAQSIKTTITPPANFTSTQSIDVLDDSKLTFTVNPVKGSPAAVGAVRLVGPLGPIDLSAFLKSKGTKVFAKKVPVIDAGTYVLEVDNVGAAGSIAIALSAAAPKAVKKSVAEPVVTGSACGDGTGTCLQSAPLAFAPDLGFNGSTIQLPIASTIRVLDPVKLRNGSKIELAIPNPLVPTQLTTRTFGVLDLLRSGGGFTIVLDRHIPQTLASPFTNLTLPAVKLLVQQGALWNSTDTSVVSEPLAFPLPADAGVPLPQFYLGWRPLVCDDVALFRQQIFPTGPDMVSLVAVPEVQRAAEIAAILAQEVALGLVTSGQRDALLYVYDNGSITGFDTTGIAGLDDFVAFSNVDLKAIAPTGALRGAVLLCFGTPCQEAIFAILGRNHTNAAYSSVAFALNGAGEAVQAILFADTLSLAFDANFCAGTPMVYLASRVADRVLQQDLAESKAERIVANAASALVLAQLLRADPAAAARPDAFVRVENTDLLAFLNSGSATNRVGFAAAPQLVAPSVVFVRGQLVASSIESFDSWIRLQFPNYFEFSVGSANPTLQAYVASMTGQSAAGFEFDVSTIANLDSNLISNLTAESLLPLLTTLRLDLPAEFFIAAH